jgi:predicted site-specific integrase-resolvase
MKTSPHGVWAMHDPIATAEILGVAKVTLAIWRTRGVGPPFVRVGRHIRYATSDINEWLAQNRRTPTAAAEAATSAQPHP